MVYELIPDEGVYRREQCRRTYRKPPDDVVRYWHHAFFGRTVVSLDQVRPRYHDLLVFPQDTTWMWLATDNGIYETTDAGQSWYKHMGNLRPTDVRRLHLGDTQIVIATMGRGVWSVPLAEVKAIRTDRVSFSERPEHAFTLGANYPNPFRRATTIGFRMERPARIRLEVFDVTGRQVTTLADRAYGPGRYEIRWTADGFASGLYFVRMSADDRQVATRRVLLTR